MTFEEMSTHKGGKMYDSMMLKTKSWKQMYKILVSKSYWTSRVVRSENGIVNTIMSRHGLAGPYGFMRMGMMLGTCVNARDDTFVIDSLNISDLPLLSVPSDPNRIPCSSAMTKLTRVMYQAGIDISKHGAVKGKVPAISTLLSESQDSYAVTSMGKGASVALIPNMIAQSLGTVYTSMSSLRGANSSTDLVMHASAIVSMVEEIDDVKLTDSERISAAYKRIAKPLAGNFALMNEKSSVPVRTWTKKVYKPITNDTVINTETKTETEAKD
ncbi:hypothetical protein LTR04_006374 [Oleoguttula sp. CCFEE 6159]|nr:hypothetical protein LTR04_006374 [Oleoguttula sp. CCFEE 6159]